MFFILRSLTKGVGNGISGKGVPPESVKPTPCNPACIWIAFLIGLVSIVYMLATSHLNNYLLTFDIISIATILGVGVYLPESHPIPDIPDGYNVSEPGYTAPELRARADRLSMAATVVDVPAGWRPQTVDFTPPAPPSVPSPSRSEPQGRIATMQRALEDDELTERMMRVAGILVTPCTVCDAGEAEVCRYVQDEPLYLLDRDRQLAAHGRRIGSAVKAGTAKITDVVAQFDAYEGNGTVPPEVWETAL